MAESDDEFYIQTMAQDAAKAKEASEYTLDRRLNYHGTEIASHGAHIASLWSARRELKKELDALKKELADHKVLVSPNQTLTDVTDDLTGYVRDVRAGLDFLEWMFFFGLVLVVVLWWFPR